MVNKTVQFFINKKGELEWQLVDSLKINESKKDKTNSASYEDGEINSRDLERIDDREERIRTMEQLIKQEKKKVVDPWITKYAGQPTKSADAEDENMVARLNNLLDVLFDHGDDSGIPELGRADVSELRDLLSDLFCDYNCFPKELQQQARIGYGLWDATYWIDPEPNPDEESSSEELFESTLDEGSEDERSGSGGETVEPPSAKKQKLTPTPKKKQSATPMSNASPSKLFTPTKSRQKNFTAVVTFDEPPAEHPIWGEEGFMHGAAVSKPGGKLVINTLGNGYKLANVFGSNNIQPGTWWPYQTNACFAGAHGRPYNGVYGDDKLGVYSVVVTAHEPRLNEEEQNGEIVWYGPGRQVPGRKDGKKGGDERKFAKSLEDYEAGNARPVRVIRKFGSSDIAPKRGFRYDGLYEIRGKKNKVHGGHTYKLYQLVRQGQGQPTMQNCIAKCPPEQKVVDLLEKGFEHLKDIMNSDEVEGF